VPMSWRDILHRELNAVAEMKAGLGWQSEPAEIPSVEFGRPKLASMEVIVLNPHSDPRWDLWVRTHPESTIFHSTAWAKVLSKTYSHKPMYLRFCRREEICALIPMMEVRSMITGRRGVCVPFSDRCAPLVFEHVETTPMIEALTDIARDRRWKYLEVRGSPDPQSLATPSVEFLGHRLSLAGGAEEISRGFASSVRRAIRKAERGDLRVVVGQTREAVLAFYRLHCRTRKQHGAPPQPLSFFLNILEEIIKPGAGFVVLACQGSRPVAGAVFFHFEKRAIYKFGASVEDGRDTRANNLVMWEGIKSLVEMGCETLDFGRTSVANEGLRRFKLGWGTREERIEYYRFDPSAGAWMTGRDRASSFYNGIFSRLPLFCNRVAGAITYRHLD